MHETPVWNRLSTRLTLLILVVVGVLAGATAILLVRGFSLAGVGGLEPGTDPASIVRGTVINLIAIFLLTLIGATLFSRSLLTEPILELVRGTRELAAGNLGVTLPVTSESELGALARGFNQMSLALAERTRDLVESNEALRASEARYELAVRGANDGLWDWDLTTDEVYLSPRWKAMLGFEEHELEASLDAWIELIHPDDLPGVREALEEHLRNGETHLQLEYRIRRADGTWMRALARGASLRDDAGRAVRLSGSLTDVTDRVRAVETLEARVQQRTSDLAALLEIGNATALTLELHPLLERILDKLARNAGDRGAAVLELAAGRLSVVMSRGDFVPDVEAADRAASTRAPVEARGRWTLPLVIRDEVVGVLQLAPPPEGVPPERRPLIAAIANQTAVAIANARLTQQVQETAAFEERQHLARELHDSVSQALYGILLGTHAAQAKLPEGADKAEAALRYVEGLAQAGIAEMRALIFELRPESLEQEGLVGVLRKQLDAMESRHGLETGFSNDGEPDLPFATKQVLYRVAQEALHNVVKHARATRVDVSLGTCPGAIRLEVRDDGVGFDPDGEFHGHLGLKSMRERVRALGGSLSIDSAAGEGARVALELPLRG